MTIKKAYQDVIDFLEANENSKVKTILSDVVAMCSAKTGGGAVSQRMYKRDEDGNITHVYCYYHKMWEDVSVVEYGSKANSPTGLNNMCKEGVSQWGKQQREARKASQDLLTKVQTGEINPGDIAEAQADIEAHRVRIVPREDGVGISDEDFSA